MGWTLMKRGTRTARFVARHRRSWTARKLAHWAEIYLGQYGNWDYDFAHNGEARVLQLLAGSLRVIFDVGANVGEWAVVAHEASPGATIHAFEVVPETAAVLAQRVESLPGVRVNDFGLADVPGDVQVKYALHNPELSRVIAHAGKKGLMAGDTDSLRERQVLPARVTTGDDYCGEHGITQIDLLKIDVEGYELRVLVGFDQMLTAARVRAIQFEYGRLSVLTHDLLRDHHGYLTERGYRVGKIYPNYVEFKDYNVHDEDFLGSNFIAVREDEDRLIEELAG